MVTWNLSELNDLKKTDEVIKDLTKKVNDFKKVKSKLNNLKPSEIISLIKKSEQISIICSKLSAFAGLRLVEKTNSSERITYDSKISHIITSLKNELLFFSIWFKDISDKKAKDIIKISGKYSYFLESIRKNRKYSLNENEERIINLKDLSGSETVSKLYDTITNSFKHDWKGKKITTSELVSKVQDPNKKIRHEAYDKLFKRYEKEEVVLAEIYKSLVSDWQNENITLRKFSSPISVRNVANDIDDKTVETLLNVIKKNKIVFQRYFKLKARLLKEKKLSREDIYAPIKLKEKEYTYEYCKKTVLEAYKEFSEEAYKFAKEIFDLNHVHSEVMPGKLSGAFCYTVTKDISPYIMLNHTGKLRDLFTMMHEFGHGIHGRAAREQTYFTFHSSLPLAETASIFGETLLEKKMLKKISTSEKISLLSKSLDDKYASIQRQAFFVLFEIDAHELIKHGATVDELNKLYKKNLEEQFGSSIIVPDKFKHEWKYIPHIYHSPFYCYAYVFGNLLGLALYGIYEEQGDKFVKNYMNVLKAGGSDSAYNILMKNLNINIRQEEFWQKAFDLIKEEVEELEKLVK